jgi:dephospho-CoA kinase
MPAQAGDEDRRALATHVIDNAGDRQALERRVDEVWRDLQRRAAGASGGAAAPRADEA